MSANMVQVRYEELSNIAGRFEQVAADNEELYRRLRQCLENLQQGGWEGDAAQRFYGEMEGEIFAALGRLVRAMESGADTTQAIIVRWQQAEEEAATSLNSDGIHVPTPPDGWLNFANKEAQMILGILELLEERGLKLGKFGKMVPLLGILTEGLANVGEEGWLQAFGSATIEEAFSYIPYVGVALTINDIYQGVAAGLQLGDNFVIENFISDPEIRDNLQFTSDAFFNSIAAQDLGNVTGPLADILYNVTMGSQVDAISDFMEDPSLSNFAQISFAISFPGIYALGDNDIRGELADDFGELVTGAGTTLVGLSSIGWTSVGTLGLLHTSSMMVATAAEAADVLPLSDSAQAAIDNAAEWYTDVAHDVVDFLNINEGIPFIPFL
jgi:WXG100 family type VII secretion target